MHGLLGLNPATCCIIAEHTRVCTQKTAHNAEERAWHLASCFLSNTRVMIHSISIDSDASSTPCRTRFRTDPIKNLCAVGTLGYPSAASHVTLTAKDIHVDIAAIA